MPVICNKLVLCNTTQPYNITYIFFKLTLIKICSFFSSSFCRELRLFVVLDVCLSVFILLVVACQMTYIYSVMSLRASFGCGGK